MSATGGKDPKTLEVLAVAILRLKGELGRTKLIKMAYLADYFSRVSTGQPITSLEYKLADHGPFDKDFFGAVAELKNRGITEKYHADWDGYRYEIADSIQLNALSAEELELVERVVDKFGDLPLGKLLEFVYSTEPMVGAKALGEPGANLPMDACDDQIAQDLGLDFKTYRAVRNALRHGDGVPLDELIDDL